IVRSDTSPAADQDWMGGIGDIEGTKSLNHSERGIKRDMGSARHGRIRGNFKRQGWIPHIIHVQAVRFINHVHESALRPDRNSLSSCVYLSELVRFRWSTQIEDRQSSS